MLRGTHWLLFSPGAWKMELADGLVVRDTSAVKWLNVAVARLQGEKLDGLKIHAGTGATTFYFDLGAKVTVRAGQGRASKMNELWSLNNESSVVAVYSGGLYDVQGIRQPMGSAAPKPIASEEWLIVARTRAIRNQIAAS